MRVRYPLYLKVLGWFFLNLAVLGVAGYVFFAMQLRLGLDSLLSGRAGERIVAVSDSFSYELLTTPRQEWRGVFQRFSEAYDAEFRVLREDGGAVGGPRVPRAEVPEEVREAIRTKGNPLHVPPHLRRRAAAAPRGLAEIELPGEGSDDGVEVGKALAVPLFLVRSEDPKAYWAGVRIRIRNEATPPPHTGILVLRSDSLLQGGLFFNARPWLLVGLGVILFCVLFWLPLVAGITRSIRKITKATEDVAEGRFDTQLDERRGDELGRLSGAINRMGDRLEGYVTGQKRFLGDIAHELCSPLARMQMALGVLEQRVESADRGGMDDLREEVEQMSAMVQELLSFSKASIQGDSLDLEPLAVQDVFERVVERESLDDAPIESNIEEGAMVLADERLFLRMLGNLLRNAVKYAGGAGPITVWTESNGKTVDVVVSDCGPGIPDDSLGRIFEPFFRPEEARTREGGGVGLGLAIVKAGVEACRGTVSFRNLSPSGFEVRLSLALATGAA